MESVQTKETSSALGALSKHKNRGNRPQNVVVQPTTVVENPTIKIEAAATTEQPPVNPPVTPASTPEPQVNDNTNWKERWSQLKTHYDTEVSTMRNEIKTLRENLTKASNPEIQLPKTEAQLEEYYKKFPEAMDIFTTVAMKAASKTSKEVKEQLAEVDKFKAELKGKEAFKRLLEFHPDAEDIKNSTKFKEWYEEQPSDIKKILAESTDIRAVAKQLDLYKLEVMGIIPKTKKAEATKEIVDASLGVDVKGKSEIGTQKKVWTGSEINVICANYNSYLKHRIEIDEARREGRVDYSK